jgi:acyl-coenzyme A thioesterase PaaI-like protein
MQDTIMNRISASFAKQGLMTTLGATLNVAEAGRVVIAMPFSLHLSQQHGFIHAGAITSIAAAPPSAGAFSNAVVRNVITLIGSALFTVAIALPA